MDKPDVDFVSTCDGLRTTAEVMHPHGTVCVFIKQFDGEEDCTDAIIMTREEFRDMARRLELH